MKTAITRNKLAAALLTTCLTACSSGNGEITDPPPPPPPQPPEDPADAFRTAEYNRSWALDYIEAAEAYGAGYTGEGVIIGITDFNFDLSSDDLTYHADSADIDPVANAIWETQVGTTLSSSPHGQAVAMVAAGAKDGEGTHGVAFDAEVLAVHAHGNVNSRTEVRNGVTAHFANPWSYMLDRGARVINLSLGRSVEALDIRQLDDPPEGITELYLQEDPAYVVEHGGLLVWAVGNSGFDDPDPVVRDHFDRMQDAGILENGDGQLILAGAIGQDGQIADFSNRAGFGAEHYLVAPAALVDIYVNGEILTGNGTSFAAPTISGAAAILMQAFPNLTAREVAEILFTTATDLGEPGTDTVYGRGLINLEAALNPVGDPAGKTRHGAPITPEQSFLSASPAFGDAFRAVGDLTSTLVTDSYNRAYRYDLTDSIQTHQAAPNLAHSLDIWHSSAFSHLPLKGVGQLSFSYRASDRQNGHHLTDRLPAAETASTGLLRDVRFSFSHRISDQTELVMASGGAGDRLLTNNAAQPVLSLNPANPDQDSYAALFPSTQGAALLSTAGGGFSYGVALSTYGFGTDRAPLTEPALPDARAAAVSARAAWQGSRWSIALGAGVMRENGSFLGTRSGGLLALGDASLTGHGSIDISGNLGGGWQLSGRYNMGYSEVSLPGQSYAEAITGVRTSSFLARLAKPQLLTDGDALAVTFSQPLRVESATLRGFFPTAQTPGNGQLVYRETTTSLAPSHRALDMELAYRLTDASSGLILQANALYQVNPGHRAGSATAFLLRTSLAF